MADKTEGNLLMKSERGSEGELEKTLVGNIDRRTLVDKVDNNLDEDHNDKAGQAVRYATLSLLYLIQVITFVCQI